MHHHPALSRAAHDEVLRRRLENAERVRRARLARRGRRTRRLGGLLTVAVLSGTLLGNLTTPADAATALTGGEVVVASYGGPGQEPGFDVLDKLTDTRSRWVTTGDTFEPEVTTTLTSNRIAVADLRGRIVSYDPVNGSNRLVRVDLGRTTDPGQALTGLAPTLDGGVATVAHFTTGSELVTVADPSGALHTVVADHVLDDATDLVTTGTGDFVVAAREQLWSIDHRTGRMSSLGPALGGPTRSMAIDRKGAVYVYVQHTSGHADRILRLDPQTQALTTASEGGLLSDFNQGMAVESAGGLVVAQAAQGQGDQHGELLRVDPVSHLQRRIDLAPDFLMDRDVTVAGIPQLGGVEVPVALDDFGTFEQQDGGVVVDTLANDRDPLGQALHFVRTGEPQHGFTTVNADGHIHYKADPGYTGPDTYAYRAVAEDGRQSQPATVHITVLADATPTAADDTFAVTSGRVLGVPAPGVLANDTDPNHDPLRATALSPPSHGTVTLSPIGGFQYRPDQGYTGPDSFTYDVHDADLHHSRPATVRLTVGPDGDAPVAHDDAFDVVPDEQLQVPAPGLFANDTDAQGTAGLAFQAITDAPDHGTVQLGPGGSMVYAPDAGFTGADTFAYTVHDPEGHVSAPATVRLTVHAPLPAAPAPAPSIAIGAGPLAAGPDGRSATFPLVTSSGATVTATSSDPRLVPALEAGPGAVTVHTRGRRGQAVVTLTATDAQGRTASVTITVVVGRGALRGTSGADLLIGSRGRDRLRGGAGRDVLLAGRGADRLAGGPGDDLLDGGAGRDRVRGLAGGDVEA